MKQSKIITLLLLSFLGIYCLKSIACIPNIENLTFVKQKLIQYHDSGAYNNDISTQIYKAEKYLQNKIPQIENKKPAIVIDIDETAISNYQLMKKADFADTKQALNKQLHSINQPAIPAVMDLYKMAEKNHIAVFFITGRKSNLRQTTIKTLHNAEYSQWQHLYMVTNNNKVNSFKTSCRKKITNQGYDIVLNVGDQFSDLQGGYADYRVKIPNPFYYVP